MVANILLTDTPSTLEVGSKGWGLDQKVIFFFSESGNVAYQIKVKEV